MNYLRDRLCEATSWAGAAVVLGLGALAYETRDPALIAAVVAGVVAILRPERGTAP